MSTSTAYILVKKVGYRYTFDGVTAISHALSLKLSTDSDGDLSSDYVNHARNEPDTVTLSVVASDAHVPVIGWSRQMMTSLCQIKELRLLCQVVTPLRAYDNMLLTALTVQQDETCPDGWTGTLTFTQADPPAASGNPQDNSSTPTSSGNTAPGGGSGSSGSGSSSSGSSGSSSGGSGVPYFTSIMNQAAIML